MAKYSINPWLEVQGMKEKVDRLMDETKEKFESAFQSRERMALWQPVADAYDSPQAYVIQMELTGLCKEQICLEIHERELRVYGSRQMEKDASGSNYQLLERSYGPFARQFILPEGIDTNSVHAVLENGLLTVTVSKKDTYLQKNIEISVD